MPARPSSPSTAATIRGKLREVGRQVGDLGGEHDLLLVDRGLRVIPLHETEPDRDRARVRIGDVHLALGDLRRLMRIGRAAEATTVAHPPLLAVLLIRLVACALRGKLGLQALQR
jgi:hypothetical protein